jgi:hypothetical protein
MPNTFKCFVKFNAGYGMKVTVEFDVELEEGDSPDSLDYGDWRELLAENASQAVYDLMSMREMPSDDDLEFGLADD